MVSSSRDRSFVSVETVWLGLPLGRRRLRFSFQINDVKDPIDPSADPADALGGGERRLSSGPPPGCQSAFSGFSPAPETPDFGAKIAWGRRGASLISPSRFD